MNKCLSLCEQFYMKTSQNLGYFFWTHMPDTWSLIGVFFALTLAHSVLGDNITGLDRHTVKFWRDTWRKLFFCSMQRPGCDTWREVLGLGKLFNCGAARPKAHIVEHYRKTWGKVGSFRPFLMSTFNWWQGRVASNFHPPIQYIATSIYEWIAYERPA